MHVQVDYDTVDIVEQKVVRPSYSVHKVVAVLVKVCDLALPHQLLYHSLKVTKALPVLLLCRAQLGS